MDSATFFSMCITSRTCLMGMSCNQRQKIISHSELHNINKQPASMHVLLPSNTVMRIAPVVSSLRCIALDCLLIPAFPQTVHTLHVKMPSVCGWLHPCVQVQPAAHASKTHLHLVEMDGHGVTTFGDCSRTLPSIDAHCTSRECVDHTPGMHSIPC